MKIKFHIDITSSERDRNGYVYYSFCIINNSTGRSLNGFLGNSNNVLSGMFNLNGVEHKSNYTQSQSTIPVSQFNRHIAGMDYAGCSGKEIANFIRKGLKLSSPKVA